MQIVSQMYLNVLSVNRSDYRMKIMNDTFLKVWTWIKSLPVWLRAVVLVLVGALALICSVSCGPTVRVAARTTTDSVTISISQNVYDSTGVSVSVNPNININPKSF